MNKPSRSAISFDLTPAGLLLNFLLLCYVLLIVFVPTSWLNHPIGEVAFEFASIVNPYLKTLPSYSRAPYFVHCHVLAFLLMPLMFWILRDNRSIRAKARLVIWKRDEKLAGYLGILFFTLFIMVIPASLSIGQYKTKWGALIWSYPWSVPIFAFGLVRVYVVIACNSWWLIKSYLSSIRKEY